ncbi:GNAT family N-acetyltransferase [Loigolactobacillus iwatensis]|uniref:GNAT family N-acetyltransferase n=1 Tax=Loigolactobacillus iwatensis TaxID=1267156 RepID=UPI000F7D8396|nr:GNAT family N-acetyltransferase [Loigolactobacillus iwatensis]
MKSFQAFSTLNLPNYQLRFLNTVAAKDIFSLRHDSSVAAASGRNTDQTLEQTMVYIYKMMTGVSRQDFLMWGIMTKETNEFVGLVQLWNFNTKQNSVEIGYEILPSWQRHGIMTEILTELIRFSFNELNLKQLKAVTAATNQPSRKLLEKVGLKQDPSFHKNTYSLEKQKIELVQYLANKQ